MLVGVGLGLHAPAADGAVLDRAEDDVFDEEAEDDDCQEAREYFGNSELILVLEDVPAEAARTGAHAEHELVREQESIGTTPKETSARPT